MAHDPDEYVKEHQATLVQILKHSSNTFTRALALAALVEYGEEADIESVIEELERHGEIQG